MANKYKVAGVKGQEAPKPLNRCFMHMMGPYANGKSRLAQSCETGFVINADCNPTTNDHPLAEIWPVPDSTGMMVDGDGNHIQLNWLLVRAMIDRLVKMQRDGVQGLPTTVFLDSLPSLLTMSCCWSTWRLIRDAEARKSPNQQDKFIMDTYSPDLVTVPDMKSLHGMTMYGMAYDEVADAMDCLTRVGYGVVPITHTIMKEKEKGRDSKGEVIIEDVPALTVSEAMAGRYKRSLDFAYIVRHTTGQIAEWTKTEDRVVKQGGKEKIIPGKRIQKTTETDQCEITTSDPLWGQFLIRRAGLPARIILTGDNAWSQFEEVYNS